jgi:hypothetical protein
LAAKLMNLLQILQSFKASGRSLPRAAQARKMNNNAAQVVAAHLTHQATTLSPVRNLEYHIVKHQLP